MTPATAAPPDATATLPWPAAVDGTADIGILCVNGIGVQAEGETLLQVARPLLADFAGDGAEVAYGETFLKPRQQLDPAPARMSATIRQGDVRARVLLAESWWAGVFDPPPYFRLLGWLLTYGTWDRDPARGVQHVRAGALLRAQVRPRRRQAAGMARLRPTR